MLMFASQLNAEMVYCILKGITQFSRVTFDTVENQNFYRMTTREIDPTYTEDKQDAIVSFNKIKIKVKDWENVKQEDLKVEIVKKSSESQ